MSFLEAVLYGLLQGLAEFLPISSSGHLSLAQNFFGAENLEENYLTFTVLLHLGTLVAVCLVYYKDVWMLIKGFFSLLKKLFTGKIKNGLDQGERLFLLLLIATLPLIPAAIFSKYVENASRISWLIGLFLILNGFMLFLSDKLSNPKYDFSNIKYKNTLVIGLIQLFGVLPGISRSGSTITGGLFMGFKKEDAVKFSFLMSIPAIIGANILELGNLVSSPIPSDSVMPVIAGVLTAIVSGLAAIKLLQYITKNKKLSVFSVYCFIIGITAIIADILT
ncbi:undecaprenyl-diphosphate phosphatase [Eubacteriales bacterium OttesenSCG-928-G02]|nr:undecaprenyl-diphosphate phosphatase [Eubacteriales bacterium OttesenSCG-928-G02]